MDNLEIQRIIKKGRSTHVCIYGHTRKFIQLQARTHSIQNIVVMKPIQSSVITLKNILTLSSPQLQSTP